MTAALGWGALAASSLVIGALLGIARRWPDRAHRPRARVRRRRADQRGQLRPRRGGREGRRRRGGRGRPRASARSPTSLADRVLARRAADGGPALALGAFLDGIPEQAVLGIGLASGEGVSVGLLAAIFVSNLPEAIGSATEHAAPPRRARSSGSGSRSRSSARSRPSPATRSPTTSRGKLPGRHQRLRRGRAAGDADRLDDPRGPRQGRRRGRPGRPCSASRSRPRSRPWSSPHRLGVAPRRRPRGRSSAGSRRRPASRRAPRSGGP